MRRLIQIPIIHTAADLGSLSGAVRARYARVCGDAGWREHERAIRALWAGIERDLDRLELDARKLRIYQDGLPVCGFEERIVRELAQAGSANHQLVVAFLDRGAVVTGTEDPRLLMEEYELQKRGGLAAPAGRSSRPPPAGGVRPTRSGPASPRPPSAPRPAADQPLAGAQTGDDGLAQRLLKARDWFIAQRIDATLQEGETGLLFLGALHRLEALESTGISLETLGAAQEGIRVSHEAVRRPRP